MKKTIRKIVIIVLCVTLFVGNAVLVYRFGYYVRNYNAFLEKYGKYDLEWMEGKPVAEVIDRYGFADYCCPYALGSYYYRYMGIFLTLETKRAEDGTLYVSSAYYSNWDTTEFASGKEATLFMWVRGKSLKTVMKKAGQPKYYVGDNAVIYDLEGDYYFAKLILDGSVESEDSVVIDCEGIGYVPRNEIPAEWRPVE